MPLNAAYKRTAQTPQSLLKDGALEKAILTSPYCAIIATDAHGIIQIFNVGAQRLLGYGPEEVVNLVRPSALHDADEVAERARKLSAEMGVPITPGLASLSYKAARGIDDNYELTYICKDGSRVPAVVSTTALRDEAQQIIGYLQIATENSARRQVETELKMALDAVEIASNAKSDFLSRMSHELRTPLNVILGFAQLIESGTPTPTTNQRHSVDQILKGGWYLLALINEILDLTMVESGRLVLSNEPIAVSEVMQECQTMIEPQAKVHGVSLSFATQDPPLYVTADRVRMKQVMINLLMNAIKYNRVGGAVEVAYAVQPDNQLQISVRDTGIGMTEAQQIQLFQPFNRLGQENGTEEGTGIGLVVTKRLMELMGGKIGVRSVAGMGSVFWIELALTVPTLLDLAEAANPAPLTEAETSGPMRTVLYVEDNPANLDLVEQIIARRSNMRLLSAATASLGIAFARTHQPDVILMDINLPGMGGIDAMKILRADPLTAHIPIVAVSANAVPRDIERGMEAGFVDYVTKPIKVLTFLQSLDAALNSAKETKS